jgi:hypothetical protein
MGGGFGAVSRDEVYSYSKTIQVSKRNVFAEVAIAKIAVLGTDTHYSEIGITQIVSDSGVEDFDPPRHVIFRTNVTSVTFTVTTYDADTLGRWLINFWS